MLIVSGLTACGGSGEGTGARGSTAPATSAPVGGGLPAPLAAQRPAWGACRDLPTSKTGARRSRRSFECATLKVPLDYARPTGDTIALAVIRTRATGGDRIGSLVLNFGGPGASGVDTLPLVADDYAKLNTRYDIVSFDPRGVGRSAPVHCLDSRQMDAMLASDGTPDEPGELKESERWQRVYVKACERRSGRVLPFVGTISAARDLDVMRAALGDRRLNYFGISYGTWLGGGYAHLLPGNLGRAVLDGPVDTKISTQNLNLQQAAAFQRALNNFADDCVRRGPHACPLGGSRDAVVAGVARTLEDLDARPLPATSGRRLTEGLGTTGVATALYAQELWPTLTQGLVQARQGDGSVLLFLADQQVGREPGGHYTNLDPANTAISCADTTERPTVKQVREALPAFEKVSPIFGPFSAWSMLSCKGWPVKGDDAAKDITAPGAARSVVVGNTGDPATPFAWAPAFTRELGSGVLLTLKGQGHGAYGTGDPCIHRNVDGYLLDGTLPAQGTTCP